MNNVMNIVNFVRGSEPRAKNFDLYTPVVREIEINKANGLESTFLLQYNAMEREDFRNLFLKEKSDSLELGVWFEMSESLVNAVGIEWRGRPGWDWDYHVNPGFLMAYTNEQREKIIDEVFRLFKEIFGEYPKVVGSWLLDSYSMEYMSQKYCIDAFVICREQYAVDAYTLWGGYYSGGYYPSKYNALCPAQSNDMQIDVPVFRMLGIDTIYGYDGNMPKARLSGCYTMEPYWPSGKDTDVMEWYFRSYYGNNSLSGSYATTGQENSMGWADVEIGYLLQIDLMKKYISQNKLKVETLGKTGIDFKNKFKKTPASVLSAFDDWSDNKLQSVWYNCINYRANLFVMDGKLFFRDVTKFDEKFKEKYLLNPCSEWIGEYCNLPVVDYKLWTNEEKSSALSFEKKVVKLNSSKELSESEIEISVDFADGSYGSVVFSQDGISAYNCGNMKLSFGCGDVKYSLTDNNIDILYKGYNYSIAAKADIDVKNDDIILCPIDNVAAIKLSDN